MRKQILFLAMLLIACGHKPAKVTLSLNKAQGTVRVNGIPSEIWYTLKNDSIDTKTWQNLFPVSAMPADTELKNYQNPLPGKYSLINKELLFQPYTPFAKGKTYFARYYIYADEVDRLQLLQRKALPGTPTYTELIFKY